MYEFLAKRIHDGKLTWTEVYKLKATAIKKIKAAFAALYPDEEIPEAES